jgi:hypothetical protein
VKKATPARETQLNLALVNATPATVPVDKERELGRALVELLLSKFRENIPKLSAGGENESEADR